MISAGRSLDHALLAEASGLESGALREALREAAAGHVIAADDEGNYAFRHALLREVVHDDLLPGEHTELHLALARALEHRMQAQGGSARLAAGIAHHYLSAGDQPAAFAAAVRAADKADEVHAHGEAADPVRARAAAVVARARPRGAGRHRPRDAAVPGRRRAPRQAQGRGALRGGAERDRRDRRALPRRRPAREPGQRALGPGRRGAQPGHARARPGAAARRRRAAPSGRCCSACGRSSSCCAGAIAAPSRRPGAALDAAEAADEPAARSRALNAMGTSLMALGEVDRGAGKLREALELAVANGCLPEMRAAYINLADLLHQRGRSEEGRAVAHEGAERTTGTGGYSAWVSTRRGRDRAGHRRLGLRRAPPPRPGPGDRHDLRELRPAPRRARPRQGRRRPAPERCSTTSTPPPSTSTSRSSSASWAPCAPSSSAAPATSTAARAAIRRALDRIETCTDDVVRLARVAAVGVVVEADAAQRACDLGDDEERRRALMEAEFHLGRTGAAAEDGGPVEDAWLRSAEAEHARANGKADPALHEAAAQAWEAVQRPYPAALMRWRAGEAHVAAGEREAATAALERAHEIGRDARRRLAARRDRGARRPRAPRPRRQRRRAPPSPSRRGPQEDPVRPHAARAPGPRPRGRGAHEPRDRRLALHGREDGQRARVADPGQARRAQPHRGRRGGPPPRASTATRPPRDPPDAALVGSPPVERIGFVGLGIMGSRQAANLRRAGYELTVYNRTRERAEAWAAEHGATVAATPAEVGAASDVIITMVVDGAQVQEVVLGENGVAAGSGRGLAVRRHVHHRPRRQPAHRGRARAARHRLRRRAR